MKTTIAFYNIVSSRILTSHCETETFNATCRVNEVILITHAQYGRMKLNRCVKQNYGHVGCFADVTELTDARCSGRRTCEIPIPDALFSDTRPCPEDLKPYFEAGYNCVPGGLSYVGSKFTSSKPKMYANTLVACQ